MSARGLLRYGNAVFDLGPGDCVSCPAGTSVAHQLGNPHQEDFVYLSIGGNSPNEVCTYPDSGKVNVCGLGTVGYLARADYMAGEPDVPRILSMKPGP